MAKSQQEETPGQGRTAASQVQTTDAVLADQDPVSAHSKASFQLPGTNPLAVNLAP